MEQLIPIGILIIFIGFVVVITGLILLTLKSKGKTEYGFGGFIGPIPFGFATRKEFLYLIIGLSIVLIIVFLFISKRF